MLSLIQHLLRGRLVLRVNIEAAEVRVKLLESLFLSLRVAGIDQNCRKYVEGHEDEVNPRANVGHCDWPHLADDDGTKGSARGGDTQTLGSAVGGEDLRRVNPSARPETHTISNSEEEDEEDVDVVGMRI